MARRGPALTALLGLLAVPGYQNRDKFSELSRKAQAPDASPKMAAGFGVIGDATLIDLEEKTGMSRADLLAALSQKLPTAIDAMTPHARRTSVDEAGEYV